MVSKTNEDNNIKDVPKGKRISRMQKALTFANLYL